MNTNLFMLDTNTVSYVLKGLHLNVRRRLNETPMENICISVITEAEGIAKLLSAGCDGFATAGSCYHFLGVIIPKAESIGAGMTV